TAHHPRRPNGPGGLAPRPVAPRPPSEAGMATFKYYAAGRVRRFHAASLRAAAAGKTRGGPGATGGPAPREAPPAGHVANAIRGHGGWHGTLFHDLSDVELLAQSDLESGAVTLPTQTVVVDGALASELRWLRDKHGFEILREGRQGKVLLRAPQG